MTGQAFLNWAITLLEQIEASPEKKKWCKDYSGYSENPGQEELGHELYLLSDQSYRVGLVITNYHKAIELCGIDERQLTDPDAEKLSYLEVLACIAWHFRRDHFAEGSLIGESIADGVLLRLFRRLRELQEGACIATTLETLYRCECSNIPDEPGVYRVLAPEGMTIKFMGSSANCSAPSYPAETLAGKYAACKDKRVLYIGKANGQRGLQQRLWQYVKYGWNKATNHKGGRAIWQIKDADLLLLEYECCVDCEEQEHQLLREYQERNESYPVANWKG